MNTITRFGSTFGSALLDFMDRAPGVIASILAIAIIVGFWFFG